MKNLFSLLLILMSALCASAQDCDDPVACCKATVESPIAIPALSELKCRAEKAVLYKIFPKMNSYKGYLFNKVEDCNIPSLDFNRALLKFEYCIPKTKLKMNISITDFHDAVYKEPGPKANMDVIKLLFQPGMVNPMLQNYDSTNKKFKHSYIHIPILKNGEHYITFEALEADRFYIHIVIDGDNLKDAVAIDAFLKEYIAAFSFE